jgi:hypothetical protein
MLGRIDPYGKKDFKVTLDWDIALTDDGNFQDLILLGGIGPESKARNLGVLRQVISLALKTKKGELQKETFFGASARGRKTYMVRESADSLFSFIKENIENSGINPSGYSINVDGFPVGKEELAIRVIVVVDRVGDTSSFSFVFTINESTQDIKTVNGFGV